MAILGGGGDIIKSIQRGVSYVSGNHEITISAVDMDKTFTQISSTAPSGSGPPAIRLTSSTTIYLYRNSNYTAVWEVIEYV